jgi:formylglycine-generating enzyme required for sulfatase activity
MNPTAQYIINPKINYTSSSSVPKHKFKPTNTKIRLGDKRYTLHEKTKPYCKVKFEIGPISFDMIKCPKGFFYMGTDEFKQNQFMVKMKSHLPKEPVTIDQPFLLGETEVTQELFQIVMNDNPSFYQLRDVSNKKPVQNVSCYDAILFCNKLSEILKRIPYYNLSILREKTYEVNGQFKSIIEEAEITTNSMANGFRLPLEKEWEYAARAGTNNRWAGTNNKDKVGDFAWFEKNSRITDVTHSNFDEMQLNDVQKKLPNEWGFYDMSGNVWELCWDEFNPRQSTRPIDRTIRGGGFDSQLTNLQVTRRNNFSEASKTDKIGFRIASSNLDK